MKIQVIHSINSKIIQVERKVNELNYLLYLKNSLAYD